MRLNKMNVTKTRLPLNLQLFAEGDGGAAGQQSQGQGQQQSQELQQSEPTFTQAQLNAMLSNEKKTSRAALLKQLGFEGDTAFDDLSTLLNEYNEQKRKGNTELQNAQSDLAKLNKKVDALTKANNVLECQVKAMKIGVKTEAVEDVVSIALAKVTDTKDFGAVLAELKTNSLYAGFFGDTDQQQQQNQQQQQGTGNPAHGGNRSKGGKAQTLAERLAEKNKQGAGQQKNNEFSYFKN